MSENRTLDPRIKSLFSVTEFPSCSLMENSLHEIPSSFQIFAGDVLLIWEPFDLQLSSEQISEERHSNSDDYDATLQEILHEREEVSDNLLFMFPDNFPR